MRRKFMKRLSYLVVLVGLAGGLMATPVLVRASADFNPKTYTCKQFLQAMEKDDGDGIAGVALAFAYGYLCAHTPNEADINPLNEEVMGAMALTYQSICSKKKSLTFLEATKAMVKQWKAESKTGKAKKKK